MTKNKKHNNALLNSESLYLRLHAHNPVNWLPWGEEALSLARSQNKPILLSIGYSACHWCHVMAHESFEDPSIAELMNALFVNIKVDREERPDLDKVYQTCFQLLMRQGGGWPLTLFLNPENHLPFFGGTYFPPTTRQGLPGFKEVLAKVADYYTNNTPDVLAVNHTIQKMLLESEQRPVSNDQQSFNTEILASTAKLLVEYSDPEHGGFGQAPKFPQPSLLYFLFDYLHRHKDAEVNHVLHLALKKMSDGGIFDHIGGGFFRYAVDQRWEIPHFEKMLYDNGQLLGLYALTGNQEIARLIAEWVVREMQSPSGAYYATLDADSEGQEGKFYVWQRDEIKKLLTDQEYDSVKNHFDLEQAANFEHHWHLTIKAPLADKDREIFQRARLKLFEARESRPHPTCNQKMIIAWNGLMIKGMALAGRYCTEPTYIHSAQRALDDIFLQSFTQPKKSTLYFLDDYAFLLEGIVELLKCEHRPQDLIFAKQLADALLDNFADEKNGGFFFTSHSHEKLIHRPKPLMDEALPSGNGIAVLTLLRLGNLLDEERYSNFAEKTLSFAWPAIQRAPYLHATLLRAFLTNKH